MSKKGELCSRIDSLVVEFFAKLSELDAKKAHLETVMADGFIQLSKTRYNMGGHRSIGSAMYDRSNMSATVNVVETGGGGEGGNDVSDRTVFHLVDPANLKKTEEEQEGGSGDTAEKENDFEKGADCNGDGLRKRKGAAKKSLDNSANNSDDSATKSPTEKPDDDAIENLGKSVCDLKVSSDGMMELQNMKSLVKNPGRSPSTSSSNTSNDPIRWFGILVPQSLKISQQRFKSSIDLIVEIANLQLELNNLQMQFKSMIKLKRSTTD